MQLPIAKVVKPSALAGQENGKLDPQLLVPCGIRSFKMIAPAARAMRALVAVAKQAGFDVDATGAYRSYQAQVNLFQSRYVTTELPGRPSRVWNGVRYWQKPKTAVAAVPGTSNHGLGLAVDLALRSHTGQLVGVSHFFVAWLIANAGRFGYSAELQSEPWHWRYVAGDKIPQAVVDFEQGQVPAPTPTPAPKPAPVPGDTYVVQPGDSYWKISAQLLGSGAKWKRIANLNDNKTLRPGDVIKVPQS
jgi:nucleoid-associated protein YgaU